MTRITKYNYVTQFYNLLTLLLISAVEVRETDESLRVVALAAHSGPKLIIGGHRETLWSIELIFYVNNKEHL